MALSADVLKKLNFMQPKGITKTFGEGEEKTEIRFYPFRTTMVHELLGLSKPLATAIATLLASDRHSRDVKSKTVTTDDKKQGFVQTIQDTDSPAISLERMKIRKGETETAIQSIIEAVIGDDSRNLLARVIVDSARDLFPNKLTDEEIKEFWDGMTINMTLALLSAVMEANATVIRPFLEKAGLNLRGDVAQAVKRAVADKLGVKTPEPTLAPIVTMPETSAEASSGSPEHSEEA